VYHPTLPRPVGTAFERVGLGLLCDRRYPAYPAYAAAGTPRVFSLFVLVLIAWLIDFINSIDFVADEDVVNVADETLGWE
jgi:hypothetical protein